MALKTKDDDPKATVTLPGTVDKIIPAFDGFRPEQAQIAVEGTDDLYREIRVENTLQDESGNAVSLKEGAEVEVTIAADAEAIQPAKGQKKTELSAKPDCKLLVERITAHSGAAPRLERQRKLGHASTLPWLDSTRGQSSSWGKLQA
jgi:hypothetical protein